MHYSQREFRNHSPERLRDAFRLTKPKADGGLTAVCEIWSHQFGWELRLIIDRSPPSVFGRVLRGRNVDTATNWKAAKIEKGWT
jgi:hypothetical protein